LGSIWLVTGPPGVGKSTVVSRVVLRLKSAGLIVGGCTTTERRVKGERVGFEVRDLTNGTQGELASVARNLGPKVGKYRLNLADLASVGAKGISDAALRSELVVIDELGPMELTSPEFRKAVRSCLDSGKPILAVVHERLEDDLIIEMRSKAKEEVELSQYNRDEEADRLGKEILDAVGVPKAS
jgi:nucleoside-triphosphatase